MLRKDTIDKLNKKYNKKDYDFWVGHHSEAFDELARIVEEKYGICVYNDPTWEDSCELGFIVSKKELTRKELKELSQLHIDSEGEF